MALILSFEIIRKWYVFDLLLTNELCNRFLLETRHGIAALSGRLGLINSVNHRLRNLIEGLCAARAEVKDSARRLTC